MWRRQLLLPSLLLLASSLPPPAHARRRRDAGSKASTRSSFEYWKSSHEVDEVVHGTLEATERIKNRRPGDAPLVLRNAMSDKTLRKLNRFKSVRELKRILPRGVLNDTTKTGQKAFWSVKSNRMPSFSYWDVSTVWAVRVRASVVRARVQHRHAGVRAGAGLEQPRYQTWLQCDQPNISRVTCRTQ
jgi:hypothetical protein